MPLTCAEMPPTKRQLEVLAAIVRLTEADGWGIPPSLRELCAALGIHSPHGIECHLRSLVAKGLLERHRKRARRMRVTPAGREALAAEPPARGGIRTPPA